MNKSFFYAICFVVILVVEIIIGIYVRDNFVRPYMGDALVVVLIYCLYGFLFRTVCHNYLCMCLLLPVS